MTSKADQIELSLSLPSDADASAPVECLGLTFANDAERRAYFLDKLREKLQDPEFRQIEGFPIGADEDILALSDPPYYTACPNPFLADFIRCYGKPYDPETDDYHREPFATDVSEGKNDPIYNAHSYHTKVPHKAIMRYILHYTEPGDVVFDGFCGTGMTGVAAQMCGDRTTVDSLGYRVKPDGTILDEDGKPFSKLGVRRAILNDLSPAATFIAYNYNTPVDVDGFEREARRILEKVQEECGWMYETLHQTSTGKIQSSILELKSHPPLEKGSVEKASLDAVVIGSESEQISLFKGDSKGRINFSVWSDIFTCSECAGEIVFWQVAVDKVAGKVRDEFNCPHCNAMMTKRRMERAWVTKYDSAIAQNIRQAKQIPVLINYTYCKKRYEKIPDAFDLELIEKIEKLDIPYWFPTEQMMFKGEKWGETWRAGYHAGITHVHHFYIKQNLWLLSSIWRGFRSENSRELAAAMLSHTAANPYSSKMRRFRADKKGGGPLSGTLYISSLTTPPNVLTTVTRNLEFVRDGLYQVREIDGSVIISVQSSTQTQKTENYVDYIFLDPPFGANLMYSELNFLWESWLKVFTNSKKEAIESKAQGKTLDDYRRLMTQCFHEAYRILKPGRWITIEFSNTQASVWNAIQIALQDAGLIVANVSALDKKQGSFKAVTTTTAVKQDLVISAYKPTIALEQSLAQQTKESVWDFIRTHLSNLPIVKIKLSKLEFITERDPRILYDRMISYFLQRGYSNSISLSSPEFQTGLKQRFLERDGMVFLPEQASAYDRKRVQTASAPQIELFVYDEKTSIDWLYHLLNKRPSTYQDIQPEYLKQVSASWRKHESRPELSNLLERNFLRYDGKEEVPSQIHSYLSTNYKDLRNLTKEDPQLVNKAKERWYVPNPDKASDLEKIRERELLKEFETYRQSKQKQIKEFRIEAMRAGFKKAWQDRDYRSIVDVADKLPNDVVEEDEKLLMYYDMSQTRLGED